MVSFIKSHSLFGNYLPLEHSVILLPSNAMNMRSYIYANTSTYRLFKSYNFFSPAGRGVRPLEFRSGWVSNLSSLFGLGIKNIDKDWVSHTILQSGPEFFLAWWQGLFYPKTNFKVDSTHPSFGNYRRKNIINSVIHIMSPRRTTMYSGTL